MGTEKSIIFHALGDIDRREKYREEFNSSTRCSISESQHSAEAKMIREGVEKDFPLVKEREGIPSFEAILSLDERRALYLETEISKDRKGLGYWYQVMMITIASPKSFPESFRKRQREYSNGIRRRNYRANSGTSSIRRRRLSSAWWTTRDQSRHGRLLPTFINESMSLEEKDMYIEFLK